MKWSKTFCAAMLLGLGLCVAPETASAQRRGGNSGYSGPSWNNPRSSNYWGNYVPGYNNPYNNPNYGRYGNNYYYRDGFYYPRDSYYYGRDSYYFAPGATVQPADNRLTSTIEVRVADPSARVTIDGQPVTQGGTVRTFQTPPLEPGYRYTYRLRMESPAGGAAQERSVTFAPGQGAVVDFTRAANSTAPAAVVDPAPIP